ncbi:MAG: DUF3137 domain-containing protein [Spirochaetes bacterium]|nr:DUF3137 domain-containing protein [Spirochaetota bacterium]
MIKDQDSVSTNNINRDIEFLDKKRSRLARNTIIIIILFALLYIPLALLMEYKLGINKRMLRIAALPAVYFIYYRIFKQREVITDEFYSAITSKIISSINPKWKHDPSKGIDSSEISNTLLIKQGSCIISKNRITGKLGKTEFQFSEVKVIKNNYISAKMPSKVFHGYFFIFNFNKSTQSKLFIRPRLFKDFGNPDFNEPLIKSDSKEFDSKFALYSSDELHARCILTPALMSRLLDLSASLNGNTSILIDGSILYLALRAKKNFIEPALFRKMNQESIIENETQVFQLIEKIIENLNMNRRIWKISKEDNND